MPGRLFAHHGAFVPVPENVVVSSVQDVESHAQRVRVWLFCSAENLTHLVALLQNT